MSAILEIAILDKMFPRQQLQDEHDVIHYRLYFGAPPMRTQHAPHNDTDTEEDRSFALQCAEAYAAFIQQAAGAYIWHKHRMRFQVAALPLGMQSPHIRCFSVSGDIAVGDMIEDEWVATWLLFRITERFADDHQLVARVWDTDGEFLLIECAEELPAWVTPESSAQRVFVRGGALHLIPPSDAAALDPHVSTSSEHQAFRDALGMVLNDKTGATRAGLTMQRCLQVRLERVPLAMQENRHALRCQLPTRAAHVLRANPEMLAAAVEAFYYREPNAFQAICADMRVFPPAETRMQRVVMSRGQYAQLKQQHVLVPAPFQHWSMLHQEDSDVNTRDPAARAAEIGMKLACGLEMLYWSGAVDQDGREWREVIDGILRNGDPSVQFQADDIADDGVEDDDDAWLYVDPTTLDEKLRRIAMEGDAMQAGDAGARQLEEMAHMFTQFLDATSSVEGVETSQPVQFDMDALMKILKSEQHDADWSDEESDGSESDSDAERGEQEDQAIRRAMVEMDSELNETAMAKSFARIGIEETEQVDDAIDLDDDDNERPLDLDFNMISSLLESVASQEGMAGPVTNILSDLDAFSS